MKTSKSGAKGMAGRRLALLWIVAWAALGASAAAAANGVGFTESFESYTNGFQVSGTNGWGAVYAAGAGTVSTDATAIAGLTAYTNNGARTFPLPAATHSNVLQITDEITNSLVSPTGAVVVVDFMVMPTLAQWAPTADPNWHYAFYLDANTNLVLWNYNKTQDWNEWTTLSNGVPVVTNGAWARFNVVQDYARGLFQMRVDNGAWVTNAAGWTGTNGTAGGSWFYMARNNGTAPTNMTRLGIAETQTNYVDDIVVTNRQVTWSTNRFTEAAANDGTIGTTLTIGLMYEAFNGTNGEVFGTNKVQVLNLPSNLTAVATYATNTALLTLTLAGAATNHTSAANASNVVIRLLDAAFALGNAADVNGSAQSNVLAFLDPPVVAWGGTNFTEAAANDGSIGTTNTVTLSGTTFQNTNFAFGVQYTNSALPAGLTCAVTRVNATNVQVTLAGNAAAHTNANSTTFGFRFLNGAFDTVAASNIAGCVTNLAIRFNDPPYLTYSGKDFDEALSGGGVIGNSNTVTLTGTTFAGNPGDVLDGTQVAVSNCPAGLVPVVRVLATNLVSIELTSAATLPRTSVTNLTVAFQDGAFNTVRAANITDATQSDLKVTFSSAGTGSLTYDDGTNFTEAVANDGTVPGALRAILHGGSTFTNVSPFTAGAQYTVTGVPAGLTCVVTRASATEVDISLGGAAAAHAAANGTNFTLVFGDGAFVGVTAGNVQGSTNGFAIHFNDPPSLGWDGNTNFNEAVANDGSIPTVNTLTLSDPNGVAAFSNTAFVAGVQYTAATPAGLTCAVTRVGGTTVQVTLTGRAAAHTAADNTSFTLQFLDGAFTTVAAAHILNASHAMRIFYLNPPSVNWGANPALTEAPANDGSIGTTNTVTLSGTTFRSATFAAGVQYTNSALPAGLTCAVTRVDGGTVSVTLSGKAASHAGSDSTSFTLEFLDGAFDTVAAANILNASNTVGIAFSNAPSLDWGANAALTEAAANDGSIAATNTVNLSGTTFRNTGFAAGVQYTNSALPAGLTCAVTRVSGSQVTVTLSGKAASHAGSDSTSFTLEFLDGAFDTVVAANIVNASNTVGIAFSNPPSLDWGANAALTEASANDGSIGTTNTVSLSGTTFRNTGFAAGVQYTNSALPGGLTCAVTRVDGATVTVTLSGKAASHAAGDSTSFTLQFLDGAFDTVAAANILNTSDTVGVAFNDPAQLTYSGSAFQELSQGTIDNGSPIAIDLLRDTFTGTNGSDFVAAHKVAVSNLPPGLTAQIVKSSATRLTVELLGRAFYNDAAQSVTNLTFAFGDAAFSNSLSAGAVGNAVKADLQVVFRDDTPFAYTVPYLEPFEAYANGAWLTLATNGWSAEYAGAGVVTAETTVASAANGFVEPLPIATTHVQTLYVQSDLQGEIHSVPGQTVYVDFLAWPTPMADTPQVSTNQQFAFYVSTNGEFVLWHCNRTGGTPTNELRVLTNAPAIETNLWTRFTAELDYSNAMFRVRLNSGAWIADAAGWTDTTGTGGGGAWFYMVQTNNCMSRFGVAGVGASYLDDLSVRTTLPFGHGTVFKFR